MSRSSVNAGGDCILKQRFVKWQEVSLRREKGREEEGGIGVELLMGVGCGGYGHGHGHRC